MATETSIQWADFSSNPIRARLRDGSNRIPGHYCQKISSGCANCYASRYQPRVGMPKFGAVGPVDPNVEIFLDEKELQRLLTSRKISGKRVFMCDMTDMFGEWVPFEMIDKLFAVFALRPDVTFQVLTKRPERMAEYLNNMRVRVNIPKAASMGSGMCIDMGRFWRAAGWPLPNVWLGTSVENQAAADERIPYLLRCQAAVRFLSCEPMIWPVDLVSWLPYESSRGWDGVMPPKVSFIITGGESGAQARPCNIEWIRSIRDQCKAAGVACFIKQLGANPYDPMCGCDEPAGTKLPPEAWIKLSDSHGGDWSEWPEDLRVRQFPTPNAGDAGRNNQ